MLPNGAIQRMVDARMNQSSMMGTRQGMGFDNDTVLTPIITGSVNENEKYTADAGLFDRSFDTDKN